MDVQRLATDYDIVVRNRDYFIFQMLEREEVGNPDILDGPVSMEGAYQVHTLSPGAYIVQVHG